ncbi:hypothetical protein KY284_030168 [Solanum tuberosum]|nr:hypothetical protein KY284_030168 [Solanum tuberosum]
MIPVAIVMAHWNPNISPLCDCCEILDCETAEHLFLKGEVADTMWKYFSGAVGLLGPSVQFKYSDIPKDWPQIVALLVRNSFGVIVGAKGLRIQDTTNLVVEAIALKEGLKFCVENGFTPAITESDSLSVINIINGVWKIPWSVTFEVNSFTRMRTLGTTRVQHSLREANILAD